MRIPTLIQGSVLISNLHMQLPRLKTFSENPVLANTTKSITISDYRFLLCLSLDQINKNTKYILRFEVFRSMYMSKMKPGTTHAVP